MLLMQPEYSLMAPITNIKQTSSFYVLLHVLICRHFRFFLFFIFYFLECKNRPDIFPPMSWTDIRLRMFYSYNYVITYEFYLEI